MLEYELVLVKFRELPNAIIRRLAYVMHADTLYPHAYKKAFQF
jgi:hypothetical protein